MCGVFENKGSSERDTGGKDALENSKGVNLLDLVKVVGDRAELEKIWVGLNLNIAGRGDTQE